MAKEKKQASANTDGKSASIDDDVNQYPSERQFFDEEYYISRYKDVKAAGVDAFSHFMKSGWREGRSPSRSFNVAFYLKEYPDVRAANINPLTHYITYGRAEGRLTHPEHVAPSDCQIVDTGLLVNPIHNGIVTGAAINPAANVTEIEILAGYRPLVSGFCIEQKPDSEEAAALPDKSGFSVSVPLSSRYERINELAIRFRGLPSTRHSLDWTGNAHPRALLIPNAKTVTDGSRIYRTELPAQQLRSSGVEVPVLCEEDAVKQFSTNRLGFTHYDVILLQRVPNTQSMKSLVQGAIKANRLVLYDVDDLMFKPWIRSEMGVIRSGTQSVDDEKYRESLQRRLDMLLMCHGAICSTPYLQRELSSMGVPAILSRNALDDRSFVNGAIRLSQPPSPGLKMLFMSGTPTHEMDFKIIKDVIADVLLRNPDSSLTLLGNIKDTSLDSLANVSRLPLVSREEMFKIVSQHDLVLVPLERTRFNLAKSSLKFMEAGAAGVPVIASDLFEFERDIRKSRAGMIARTPAEWRQAIQIYIDKPNLGREHGTKSFYYCLNNYSNRSRGDYLWREICRFDEFLSEKKSFMAGVDNNLHDKMIAGLKGRI